MSVVVSAEWLSQQMEQGERRILIIDTRFDLKDEDAGRKAYIESHIPKAVYLDLEKDLSGKPTKHGGSHPLPDMNTFTAKMGNIGIDRDTTVVIYDQSNDMFAARLWWLLDYTGHNDVHVLDGGFDAWVKKGYPITADLPPLKKRTFVPIFKEQAVADIRDVEKSTANTKTALIDSRDRDRYLGKREPLYHQAGHIPGAKNYVWHDVFDVDGYWKDTESLEKQFASLNKNDPVIVSCGSGVSACANVLALKSIGFRHVTLYPGSYSDWISYENNAVETKDET